jgi:hypothetical protein
MVVGFFFGFGFGLIFFSVLELVTVSGSSSVLVLVLLLSGFIWFRCDIICIFFLIPSFFLLLTGVCARTSLSPCPWTVLSLNPSRPTRALTEARDRPQAAMRHPTHSPLIRTVTTTATHPQARV